jgi:hypothetical protein
LHLDLRVHERSFDRHTGGSTMKRNTVFALMLAAGSLAATAARAQENSAGGAATACEGQTARSDSAAYGRNFREPGSVDADGVPVPKPNPISRFLQRSRELGTTEVEAPFVDDWRTDGPATAGETN